MNVASNWKGGHAIFTISVKYNTAPASAAPIAKSMCEVKQLFCSQMLHWGGGRKYSCGTAGSPAAPSEDKKIFAITSRGQKMNADRHKTEAD